jgi:hypothetical protein
MLESDAVHIDNALNSSGRNWSIFRQFIEVIKVCFEFYAKLAKKKIFFFF